MVYFTSFVVLLALICNVVMYLSLILAKKTKFNREKSSPFECGFDPNSGGRLPFSLRFFLITVIFLIFDVEIVFFLPVVFSFMQASVTGWFITTFLFLTVLLLGLLYEWKQGALEWTN